MRPIDRLFVLWRDPTDGTRFVVGHLWRDTVDGGFSFGYVDGLDSIEARGFMPLVEAPREHTLARPLHRRHLFSVFARRIPSPARPEYASLMESWGVVRTDDPIEVLARSGGLMATDRLELAEFRSEDDDLRSPLQFRLAGEKYQTPSVPLQVGDALTLRRDRTNAHDDRAVLVESRTGTPIAFVPRQYSALFARHLDAGVQFDVRTVRRLLLPEETGRWVVEARRT